MSKSRSSKATKKSHSTNGRIVKTSTRHGRVTVAQARRAVAAASRKQS